MDAQATSTDGTENSIHHCETVQYMLPTVKQFPKLEPRFYNGIWLGKDTKNRRIPHLTVTFELVRCTTESNVYRSKDCLVYIMIYVDDLLFIGVQSIINTLFSRIQKEVLLRHTGDRTVGSTIHFLGRNISHRGDHIDISLSNNYVDITLEESGMTTCNPAPSPIRGITHERYSRRQSTT